MDVNRSSQHGKQYGGFPKILIKLKLDPVTPLLGIYTKEMKTEYQKDISTLMFTTAYWQKPRNRNIIIH